MAETAERNYHLGFARASIVGLFDEGVSLAEALKASWTPGATTARYGRRWHLTKIITEADGVFYGRIGFVADDEVSTLRFDPEVNDFVRDDAPSGVVVPFAIRESDGIVVFQLRPGVVRETTFTGAFEQLLNESDAVHLWEVRTFTEQNDFGTWLEHYPSVTRFDITLERPNPHYHGADKIEEAIEEVRLESLKLVGRARAGESIDPDADFFRQALDHVTRDYGKAKLVGSSPDGNESVWVKLKGIVSGRVATNRIRRATGGEEAPQEVLMAALADGPTGELVNMNDQDDD